MNNELTEKLFTKYPKIFRDKTVPMSQSLVCFGFEYGDGWYDLTEDLCKKLQTIADLGGPQFVASQMKEKYAGLRFYGGGTNSPNAHNLTAEQLDILDELSADVVARAESKSSHTCEDCGEHFSETFILGGWYYALCNECSANLILGRMLGQWPAAASTTTREQKLELIKAKGLMWPDCLDMLSWAEKHLPEVELTKMMHLSSYLSGATTSELELLWLWYIDDRCNYTRKVLELLGVPAKLIADLDHVQTQYNAQWLYSSDNPRIARVVIALMKWNAAQIEKRYITERAKYDEQHGSTSAGSEVGNVDRVAEVDGSSEGPGTSVGSSELDSDDGEATQGVADADQSKD